MNRPRSWEDWEQFIPLEEEVEPIDFQQRYEEFLERTENESTVRKTKI